MKDIMVFHARQYEEIVEISDVSLKQMKLDYRSPLKLRFAVPEDCEHVGGLTIFGCFGTKLGRNCDLVDFLRGRDEVRDNIFHKPLGEPDNACVPTSIST